MRDISLYKSPCVGDEYVYYLYIYIYIYLLFLSVYSVCVSLFSFLNVGFVLQQDERISLSLENPDQRKQKLWSEDGTLVFIMRGKQERLFSRLFGPSPLSITIGPSPKCNFDFECNSSLQI